MSLINAIVVEESFGRLASAFALCLQNRRKNSRCERRKVSGCTMKSACFHVRTTLAQRAPGGTYLIVPLSSISRKEHVALCSQRTFLRTDVPRSQYSPQQERGGVGFGPGDVGDNPLHSVHSPLVKMSRCMLSIVLFLWGIGKEQETA